VQFGFDASENHRPAGVSHSGRATLVPSPTRSYWKIGEFPLEALDHDTSMSRSPLLTNDQLAVRWPRGTEDVDGSGQQGGIVAYHDEDAIED
jgi:hypothetical protein